uniref:Uncharacterized protein n=1 Tax=Arundo donax TaxID=35708 RepID=A0A0A9E8A9_ARUDO
MIGQAASSCILISTKEGDECLVVIQLGWQPRWLRKCAIHARNG